VFFFSSRRRHTRFSRNWSSDVCSSDLKLPEGFGKAERGFRGLTGVGCGGRRDQIVGNPRPLLAYRNDQLRQDKPGVGKALPNPEIGRASCRERVRGWAEGGSAKEEGTK